MMAQCSSEVLWVHLTASEIQKQAQANVLDTREACLWRWLGLSRPACAMLLCAI